MPHIWLRDETKTGERRSPLTPRIAEELIDAGFLLTVERSTERIFPDSDFEAAGATLVPPGAWTEAPADAVILGLKGLPPGDSPLHRTHIYFAHAFKKQAGWEEVLARFAEGGGTLLDLEFLVDEENRRVAAFGYWAGYVGAALAVDVWAYQQLVGDEKYPEVRPFNDRRTLLGRIQDALEQVGTRPQALVIGSRGRCGRGAREMLDAVGVSTTGWDIDDTRRGGPFEEILERELFINTVLVSTPIPAFITKEMVERSRRLSVICDVSCDPASPLNPLPVYTEPTTFLAPVKRLKDGKTPMDLVAIDHLPGLLPREASESFASQLAPHFKDLHGRGGAWGRANATFRRMLAKL